MPLSTAPWMTAFSPGQSPPLVRIPIFMLELSSCLMWIGGRPRQVLDGQVAGVRRRRGRFRCDAATMRNEGGRNPSSLCQAGARQRPPARRHVDRGGESVSPEALSSGGIGRQGSVRKAMSYGRWIRACSASKVAEIRRAPPGLGETAAEDPLLTIVTLCRSWVSSPNINFVYYRKAGRVTPMCVYKRLGRGART
jgi:hypothetical protein